MRHHYITPFPLQGVKGGNVHILSLLGMISES